MYRFNKETLDFEKISILKYFKYLLAIIAIMFTIGFATAPRAEVKNLSQEEKLIVIREYNEFTETALIAKIKTLNFKYPHIVLAQSYLETGHYKSVIFKENNNMFGMREAAQRANLAKGTHRNHAYYDNWQDSLLDYALYYSTYLYDIKTEGEYFEYLRQNYAEDRTYVDRLKEIIKKRNLKSIFDTN
jgi:uncharacterized FlgJ-related protein